MRSQLSIIHYASRRCLLRRRINNNSSYKTRSGSEYGRSSRFFSTTAESTASTTTPQRPWIVSRRAWEARKASQTTAPFRRPPEKATEWPEKVRYGFYVVAAAFIPYVGVGWVLSSSESNPLRARLLQGENDNKDDDDSWSAALRRHYGEADHHALSYVDVVEDGRPVPHRLLDSEGTPFERRLQAQIAVTEAQPTAVRVRRIENHNDGGSSSSISSSMEKVVELPGTTRMDQLETALGEAEPSILNEYPPSSDTSFWAVEFPDAAASQDMKDATESWVGTEENVAATDNSSHDPALKELQTFSRWHYFPPGVAAATADSSTQSQAQSPFTDHQVATSRLEYEIQGYEAELRGASVRPVDDILADMQKAKAELRSLQWKQWIAWPWKRKN